MWWPVCVAPGASGALPQPWDRYPCRWYRSRQPLARSRAFSRLWDGYSPRARRVGVEAARIAGDQYESALPPFTHSYTETSDIAVHHVVTHAFRPERLDRAVGQPA